MGKLYIHLLISQPRLIRFSWNLKFKLFTRLSIHIQNRNLRIRKFSFLWRHTSVLYTHCTNQSPDVFQIACQPPKQIREKIVLYFSSWWNMVDVVALGLFLIVSILRIVQVFVLGDKSVVYEITRVIYILDIIPFLVRSLQLFSVNRQLGPKLVMIFNMVRHCVHRPYWYTLHLKTFHATCGKKPNRHWGWEMSKKSGSKKFERSLKTQAKLS